MCSFLNLSKVIVVPICTEWLILDDFVQLDCSSNFVRRVLSSLSKEYNSRFQLLLASDVIVPMSVNSVKWFDRHPIESNVSHRFTADTLSLLHPALLQRVSILSSLAFWRTSRSSSIQSMLSNFLKRMTRMVMTADHLGFKETEIALLRESFEKLVELHINNNANLKFFTSFNFSFVSRLQCLRLTVAPSDDLLCSLLRQTVCLQRLRVDEPLESLYVLGTVVVHCRMLSSVHIVSNRVHLLESRRAFTILAFHNPLPFTDLRCQTVNNLLFRSLLSFRGGPSLLSLTYATTSSSVERECITTIASLAPQLTSLTPFDLDCVTLSLLSHIKAQLVNLTELNLSHSFDFEEAAVKLLLTDFPVCSSLDLTRNSNITDFTFYPLNDVEGSRSSGGSADNKIEHLNLQYCHQLTDSTLFNLPLLCGMLTSLNLSGLNCITDACLMPVLQTGKLRRLNISHTSLTQWSLLYIAQFGSSDMRELIMNQLPHGPDSLMEVVKCCKGLKSLQCDVLVQYDSEGNVWSGVETLQDLIKAVNPRVKLRPTAVRNSVPTSNRGK